jgi:hypothetical protein
MPSNEIPNEDLGTVDGAAPGSDTDHIPVRILGKRPREDGEPQAQANSDEDQVRVLPIGYVS